ncbi:hypothetical protein A9Q83_13755 [Alphaproteobacteria bacterium 46_93_T64]|nr:hypothetical protein A9Q83_13755 [Alphaproteobacteria bacterium 46_93_T64]
MIIAHLSDPHVDVDGTEFHNLYQTTDKFKVAIEKVCLLSPKPEAIVITGDLVNNGNAEAYDIFNDILKLTEIPVYLGIGNHDCRETFRTAFSDHAYLPEAGFIQYAWDMNGHQMIMLDTNIPNEPGGILCSERLAWLDKTLLSTNDTPTTIFMHHPPFKTGIKAMDDMGLEDADAFGAIIKKHKQIQRIYCGHLHRSIQSDFYGVQTQICPSTTHKVLLHLEDTDRLATTAEPSEILLHMWDKDGNIVTHSCFTEPYPILWESD